ncbi:MAG TPA: hypothetical protein VNA26_01945 [Chitinophagaceae bacterium]|nr:hypothetical protein [Chitinophagaceae bacterium]
MNTTNADNLTVRRSGKGRKIGRTILAILLLGLIIIFYWRFYYVFGEGVKAGELNFLVKKGYIFKTYEGKIIQSGFKGGAPGSIQSYEFEFSVQRDDIANTLMLNSGKEFELHYKEYMGVLPWRGHSRYIVDSIVNMRAPQR